MKFWKARESKIEEPARSGSGDSLFTKDAFPIVCLHITEGADRIPEACVVRTIILLLRVEPWWPSHPVTALPLHTAVLGVSFLYMNRGGHSHTPQSSQDCCPVKDPMKFKVQTAE